MNNPETDPKPENEIQLEAGGDCPSAYCSACEELRREVAHLMTGKVKLHAECQKYRVALNRVAHPETWGVNSGHHVEIARRALVIGMKVDPLPEAAKIRKAFVCVGCDFVYCDDPPTSCDCMNNPPKFIKGEIRYFLPNAELRDRRPERPQISTDQ